MPEQDRYEMVFYFLAQFYLILQGWSFPVSLLAVITEIKDVSGRIPLAIFPVQLFRMNRQPFCELNVRLTSENSTSFKNRRMFYCRDD
ncbi:MAG: hypothetical protein Ct9H300mP21_09090 [Pseudomonadota bacterium]|nr:MAG: hypothetical protein Ct9H300mP21_09090 [Pseudomonadota bacterium]